MRYSITTRLAFVLLPVLASCLIGIWIAAGILANDSESKPDEMPNIACRIADFEPPTIKMLGAKVLSIKSGEEYVEEGIETVDECDVIDIDINGQVDTSTTGRYEITYVAIDEAGNRAQATRTIYVIPEFRGIIYLTFDDGPGAYTAKLLDILAAYDVKATFFVTGSGDDALIRREYDDGHAIGLHTYSHDYAYVYQNMDTFFEDLYAVQERVKNITGQETYLMRFPGGSSNTVSRRYDRGSHLMSQLVNEVERRGFTYFDWNVTSGDAGQTTDTNQVAQNVTNALAQNGNYIVLQHDIKDYSVDAVDQIIQYGLLNGFVFEKLDASAMTAHHRVNN